MASTIGIRAKLLARLAAPLLLAAGLNACSSIPDWVDPTTWIGGDSEPAPDQTSTDQSNAGTDAAQTPDIAAIPPKPQPPSTTDEQKQVADTLAADRTQAHYSADALRGGTEASAPPPAEAPQAADSGTSVSAATAPSADQNSAPPAVQTPPSDQSPSPAAATPPAGDSLTAAAPGTPDQATSTASSSDAGTEPSTPPAAQPLASGTEVANTESSSTAAPAAVPATAEAAAATSPPEAGNMQATFAPSRAPALDPSVAQFVPQPILLHYHETASGAGASEGAASPEGTTVKHHRHKKKAADASRPAHMAATGDGSSGVALNDAASGLDSNAALQPASYEPSDANVEIPNVNDRASVIFFPRDTTILDPGARSKVKAAAAAFTALGGRGYVRVVGHASSQTPEMSLAQHMMFDFERSQARATSVARELIRDGVQADHVLVEAVGDTQPREAGKVAHGEDASRLAEIFLQS